MSFCVSCGSKRVEHEGRPAATDEAAWTRIATEHDLPCRWVTTRGNRLRLVFTLLPHNGTRHTATLWRVGQLADVGEFVPVTDPLSKAAATEREQALRAAAQKARVQP